MNLSDRAVSYLRTIVPVLWGSLIGLLVQAVTWLPEPVTDWLRGDVAVGIVTAAAIAAWYWVWRRLEAHVPDWLTRVVLGSAQTPAYSPLTDLERAADAAAAASRKAIAEAELGRERGRHEAP